MHTEAEAMKKQCKIQNNGLMYFYQDDKLIETTTKAAFCIGSQCFHWVWSKAAPHKGHCGLNVAGDFWLAILLLLTTLHGHVNMYLNQQQKDFTMNPRYKYFLKTSRPKNNAEYMIFISDMKKLYLESIGVRGGAIMGHIEDHDAFTEFIANNYYL